MNVNKYLIVVVGVFIGSLISARLILGGARPVKISAGPLSFQVANNLNNGSYLPVEGWDYRLSYRYFQSKQWVVVSVLPLKSSGDPQTIVYHLQKDNYQLAAGPANDFTSQDTKGLPTEVVDYLKSKGLL